MTSHADDRPVLLGCGILQKEIRCIAARNCLNLETHFLDSMLHVDFDSLEKALRKTLSLSAGREVLVFYGACHPLMDRMLADARAVRLPGQNCVEMLLGEELFNRELSGGAYFLLEEWALRWEEMIHKIFGNHDSVIRSIFQEDRTSLLGIRTPCSGDFRSQVEAAGVQTGLPVRWLDVSLDHLEKSLLTSLSTVARGSDASNQA